VSGKDKKQLCSGYKPNTLRGVSVFFGEDTVQALCEKTGVELIVRAHQVRGRRDEGLLQVMQAGYGFFANRKLVTVFTAPRYYAEKNNKGAVMFVTADGSVGFKLLVPPHDKCESPPSPSRRSRREHCRDLQREPRHGDGRDELRHRPDRQEAPRRPLNDPHE